MADEIDIEFGGRLDDLTAALNEAKEQIEGLTAPIGGLKDALLGLSEAAGVAFAVDKILEYSDRIDELGAKVDHATHELGMSAEQVSVLNSAFAAMGIGGDGATRMLERLERNMVDAQRGAGPAAAAFKAVGISFDELKTLSPQQLLERLAQQFEKTADGPNKTAIAIALMGRTGAEMIPFLDRGTEGLAEFETQARASGTVLTGEMARGLEESAIKSAEVGQAMTGLGIAISERLKPALDAGKDALIGVARELTHLLNATDLAKADNTVAEIDRVVAALHKQEDAQQALERNLKRPGLSSDQRESMTAQLDVATRRVAELKLQYAGLLDTYDKLQEKLREPADGGKPQMAAMGDGAGADPTAELQKTMMRQMADWKIGYDQMRAYEIAFWRGVEADTSQSAETQTAARVKVYQLETQEAKKASEQQRQISREDAESAVKAAQDQYEAAKKSLDQQAAAGKISVDQQIAQEKELLRAKMEAQVAALRATISSGADAVVANRKVMDQIREIVAKEKADEANLDTQGYAERQKAASEWAAFQQKLFTGNLEFEKSTLAQEVSANQITMQQELTAQRDFIAQEWAATKAALEQQLEGRQAGTAEALKLYEQLYEGAVKYNNAMTQNTLQQWQEIRQNQKAVVDDMSGVLDDFLNSSERRGESFAQRMNQIWARLAISFDEAVAKMILEWTLFGQVTETGPLASLFKGATNGLFGSIGGGLAGLLPTGMQSFFGIGGGAGGAAGGAATAQATQALTTAITGQTLATGLNTTASTSNTQTGLIPSIMNMLGLSTATTGDTAATTAAAMTTTTGLIPALMALTISVTSLTSVMAAQATGGAGTGNGGLIGESLGIMIPTFDTGASYIPSDTLGFLHAGEMVIPPDIAAQTRSGGSITPFAAGSIGAAGIGAIGAGAAAGPTYVTLNLSAVDGQSAKNFLVNQQSTIATVLANAVRGGNSSLRAALKGSS